MTGDNKWQKPFCSFPEGPTQRLNQNNIPDWGHSIDLRCWSVAKEWDVIVWGLEEALFSLVGAWDQNHGCFIRLQHGTRVSHVMLANINIDTDVIMIGYYGIAFAVRGPLSRVGQE